MTNRFSSVKRASIDIALKYFSKSKNDTMNTMNLVFLRSASCVQLELVLSFQSESQTTRG
jgi:hypothetical protein